MDATVPDNDRDEDFVIADDGEIVMTDEELPPLNEEAALDIVDGHEELNADDLTIDIVDDYGG